MNRRAAAGLVLAVVLALSGCNAGRSAIQRFDDAVTAIARSTGTTADDVGSRIRATVSGSSDDALAEAAEQAASRTGWVDDAVQVARPAARIIDDPSLRAMTGASCETLSYFLASGTWPTSEEFVGIVADNLLEQGFDDSWPNIEAASNDVIEHLEGFATGAPDVQRLFLDAICLAV